MSEECTILCEGMPIGKLEYSQVKDFITFHSKANKKNILNDYRVFRNVVNFRKEVGGGIFIPALEVVRVREITPEEVDIDGIMEAMG